MNFAAIILAVLSIWEYPARQPEHERLKDVFVRAVRKGDTAAMYEASSKGVKLLPEDPVWAYNLACSLAYRSKQDAAYRALERAIDLGFRNADVIAADQDLARLADRKRFEALVKYARDIARKPILTGPLASVPSTCVPGETLSIGAQNLAWNFDFGCFEAKAKILAGAPGGNRYDLYMNRDAMHSRINTAEFPGLTEVMLDREARGKGFGLNFPDMFFPYPVFGNSSRAFVSGAYWRSIPRSLMTLERRRLKMMEQFYLSNQTWVFPANADYPPVGKHGDCFLSVAPYWFVTAGASWSDLYYVKAALEVSRSLDPRVKEAVVSRGMLAPLVQCLVRHSLKSVTNEVDYLSPRAHPPCMPPQGIDVPRLVSAAKELEAGEIPPVAFLSVSVPERPRKDAEEKVKAQDVMCLYALRCAVSLVLGDACDEAEFLIRASGGTTNEFAVVNGEARLERLSRDTVKLFIDASSMTSRVDVAVFARTDGSRWGAPSFVSIARRTNPSGYTDPFLGGSDTSAK